MEKLHDDPALAEAIARRDESRAQILRSRATAAGGTAVDKLATAFGKLADQAAADSKQSADAAGRVEPTPPDPEGTARQLADSEGNFAPNAEVAAVGGIGIDASNTDVTTGKPAQTIDQAGVATTEGAEKIVGDQAVGTATTSRTAETDETRAAVAIPEGWKDLSWQERRSLASKLTDDPVSNGEQANAAIEAELAKRG